MNNKKQEKRQATQIQTKDKTNSKKSRGIKK